MFHLSSNTVSQICFGLTSRYFYQLFVDCVHRHVVPAWEFPVDLRMTVDINENHMLYGSVFYEHILNDPEIEWQRSLFECLEGESLWHDLIYCAECVRYKPESAFEEFDFELQIRRKHSRNIENIESSWIDYHWNCCKRCRIKELLVCLERKEQVYECVITEIGVVSLGLIVDKKDWGGKVLTPECTITKSVAYFEWTSGVAMPTSTGRSDRMFEAWEDIFARLGI